MLPPGDDGPREPNVDRPLTAAAAHSDAREAGVTCTSESSGHGFFIARDRYVLF
jgi:hypothetical protein